MTTPSSDVLSDVARKTGLDSSASATAVSIAVELLAPGLGWAARHDLIALVPDQPTVPNRSAKGGPGGRPPSPRTRPHAEELYWRIGHELGMSPAQARETAQVVCQALHAHLPAETRILIHRDAHPTVAALFSPSAAAAAPSADEPAARSAGAGRTLATGQPGSRHSVADTPPSAQRESVVRATNPHAERKLSSGQPGGPSGPGSPRDLAEGQPGSDRPIVDAGPED